MRRAREGRAGAEIAVPVGVRLLGDQLTPVLAYRRLVVADDRLAPSFLFESVENGDRQGRYSILGAHPVIEVVAYEHRVRTTDRRAGAPRVEEEHDPDPLMRMRLLTRGIEQIITPGSRLPSCMLGGWVGFAGYDTVRYAEPGKLPFSGAPRDDRALPDLHFGFYDQVVVFDHVEKVVYAVALAIVGADDNPADAFDRAGEKLRITVGQLQTHARPLASGLVSDAAPVRAPASNLSRPAHAAMVEAARGYIRAGDIFQVVLGQRFERRSQADPFDVYRALRVVNPSPYMVYLQAEGCLLVASSPEILCRVRKDGASGESVITNRPLAGTRRRGADADEDSSLERELLADHKERAEHIMLVDLGRNDVGRVAEMGSVRTPALMEIERYSHVMHISSTVTGVVRAGLDCWDALRATLPVGTISGAPKIRAMQIIDELEPVRRGPYGGGFGYATLDGQMDIALALRTIVVPGGMRRGDEWTYHLQAAGGIVFDSDAEAEYQETVNKAAALERAIDLAERAFADAGPLTSGP